MGVFGVKNCNKPEKANVCLIFAIIAIVFLVVNGVVNLFTDGAFNWYSIILFVLPVLYLIGAIMNKNAAVATPVADAE